ncbi:hypothetical protein AAXB25_14855 [Paenibacillus lautus]|uniref:hypothetical protein n=1 Tax=Paenibacillus lautus TaxID=1401 RepID=UPI003D2B37BF
MDREGKISAIQVIADRSKFTNPVITEIVNEKGNLEDLNDVELDKLYTYCINVRTK